MGWRQVLAGAILAVFSVGALFATLKAVVVGVVPFDPKEGCLGVLIDVYEGMGTTTPTDDVWRVKGHY